LRERASVLAKKTKALNRNANRCRKASRRAGR
jgi:hypothetical protein